METIQLLQVAEFVVTILWVGAVCWLVGDLAGRALMWWLERREKKRELKWRQANKSDKEGCK